MKSRWQDEKITKKQQKIEDFNVIPMQLDYDYENNTKRLITFERSRNKRVGCTIFFFWEKSISFVNLTPFISY